MYTTTAQSNPNVMYFASPMVQLTLDPPLLLLLLEPPLRRLTQVCRGRLASRLWGAWSIVVAGTQVTVGIRAGPIARRLS